MIDTRIVDCDHPKGRGAAPVNSVLIPFPGLEELPRHAAHTMDAGGMDMTIKHTHPVLTQEERLAQLQGIKKLCSQLLHPKEPEARAG